MKKIIALFLSFYLFILGFTPAFAQNPPPGGWKWDNARVTVEKDMQRIRLGVEAQKTYPVAIVDPKTNKITQNVLKAQKSAIKIAPTATKVGKSLIKRAPNVAITNAVIAILGKSVDWVLDPENNSVKYKDNSAAGTVTSPGLYTVGCMTVDSCTKDNYVFAVSGDSQQSADIVCDAMGKLYGFRTAKRLNQSKCAHNGSFSGSYNVLDFAQSDLPESSSDYKYIPIETVAQKVIDQAEDGQAPALEVMSDTALDMLEAGELDSALDAAAEPKQYGENEYPPDAVPSPNPNPDPDGENPTDPENPNPNPNPEPMPWPAFCDWATAVCDWIDWSKEEPESPEDTTVDIETPIDDFDSDKSYVTFTGSCPPNYTASLSIMGNNVPFSFDYQPICTVMIYLSPFIKGAGYLSAGFIIAGIGRSGSKE